MKFLCITVTGGPRTPHLSNDKLHKLNAGRVSSNGISFDSDKGEFKEFVDVGAQTSQRSSMVSTIFFMGSFTNHVDNISTISDHPPTLRRQAWTFL